MYFPQLTCCYCACQSQGGGISWRSHTTESSSQFKPEAVQDELFYDSRDYSKIILVTVMFSASTSSDSNTYDFFSEENLPKWKSIFISALNLVSIFKVVKLQMVCSLLTYFVGGQSIMPWKAKRLNIIQKSVSYLAGLTFFSEIDCFSFTSYDIFHIINIVYIDQKQHICLLNKLSIFVISL